jgi:hypothetical protein
MAKVTLIFAVLSISLGLVGFFGTGGAHYTALIPTWFGLALGFFGLLAMSPDAGRRKVYMHINVTIGLLGFLGGAGSALSGYLHATSRGLVPEPTALAAKATLAALMLVYVLLCVRSFIAARRTGKV